MSVLLVSAAPGASAFPPFDDCKSPPMPSDPAGGFLSTLDPMVLHDVISGPLPTDSSKVQGELITWYGYAGLQWSTYDLGCGGSVRDPGASVDTMFGGFFLWTAKALFAAQQGLEDLVYGDETKEDVTDAADKTGLALYNAIFSPWAGAALVLAGSVMMIASRRGDVGEVLTRLVLVLVAVGIAALSFGSGAQLSRELSGTLKSALQDAKSSVAAKAFPPRDGSTPRYAMRDAVYQQILYRSWKNGEVGSYGRDEIAWELYQAQALDYNEWWSILDAKVDQEQLYKDKGQRWMDAADSRTTPTEYTNIQGKGESRTAAGAGALMMIAPITVLQIFALLIQYLMFLFLAFLPAGAPLVALLGIVNPDTPEKAVKVVGAVVFGGIVASVCVLVHSIVVMTIASRGDMTDASMILVSWGSAAILYKVLKPIVALTGIFSSARAMTGHVSRRAGRVSRWLKAEARHREAASVGARQHEQLVSALRARNGSGGRGPESNGPSTGRGGPPGPGGPGGPGGDAGGGRRPDGPTGGPTGGPRTPRPNGGGASPMNKADDRRPGDEPGARPSTPPYESGPGPRGSRGGGASLRGVVAELLAGTRPALGGSGNGHFAQSSPGAPQIPRLGPRSGTAATARLGVDHTAPERAAAEQARRRGPGLYRPPARVRGSIRPEASSAVVAPRPEVRRSRQW
ncbi:hypothetical protein LWC33_29260 [Pseudonocardia sp. RS11V-5]|uniref:hypothetical protein n=1 Tax=Pseudonocardia terrae TaxID=2905831 RepID=UPI001E3ABDE2|nr:hypothetical protein [Pseudonocardia terrae]MCE3555522.1 hypothetical protein [Pseudonocardia terrae]